MRPYFLVVLLFLLGCASTSTPTSYRQAAVRPAPAPAGGIIQGMPSYPGATYTPAGAGAPMVGQPGQQVREVPRSPNKRMLPPTKEPGLWAADGAPRGSEVSSARIIWTPLPRPAEEPADGSTAMVDQCAEEMNKAIDSLGLKARIGALTRADQKCFAAQLYYYCTSVMFDRMEVRRLRGLEYVAPKYKLAKETNDVAFGFQKEACDGDALVKLSNLFREVAKEWKKK